AAAQIQIPSEQATERVVRRQRTEIYDVLQSRVKVRRAQARPAAQKGLVYPAVNRDRTLRLQPRVADWREIAPEKERAESFEQGRPAEPVPDVRAQLRVCRPEEIGRRAVARVSVRRRVERHSDITRRASAEPRRRQIEALQSKRERQLQTVGEQPGLILCEEGVAALSDVERAARRVGTFVAREV